MGKLNVVGIGPGAKEEMTYRAYAALKSSDIIVGYTKYIALIKDEFPDKKMISTGMGAEEERCEKALRLASEVSSPQNNHLSGKTVSLICSGDGVIYGMAGLVYELSSKYRDVQIEVIPGVTAAVSGSALIGAGCGNDFAVISLSNYLTAKEDTYRRLKACAEADMVMALYNPVSKTRPECLKEACEFLMKYIEKDRLCAVAKNIGRENENYSIMTLQKLMNSDADMFSTVFIGNSQTVNIDGKFVTKRGYRL